jgi:hypothetical protein
LVDDDDDDADDDSDNWIPNVIPLHLDLN